MLSVQPWRYTGIDMTYVIWPKGCAAKLHKGIGSERREVCALDAACKAARTLERSSRLVIE